MAKSLLDKAMEDLLAWASDFREGKVHRPLLAPHPEGYERWGAKISRAGFVPAAYEFEDPGLITVGGDEHKQAVVTSERAISCSGARVHQTWRLSDLYQARALDDLTGVVLLRYEPGGRGVWGVGGRLDGWLDDLEMRLAKVAPFPIAARASLPSIANAAGSDLPRSPEELSRKSEELLAPLREWREHRDSAGVPPP